MMRVFCSFGNITSKAELIKHDGVSKQFPDGICNHLDNLQGTPKMKLCTFIGNSKAITFVFSL